jgi:hypothetical protein
MRNRRLCTLILIALLLAVGHHLDHIIRGNHVGWPLTAQINACTVSLIIYPLILTGLALSPSDGCWHSSESWSPQRSTRRGYGSSTVPSSTTDKPHRAVVVAVGFFIASMPGVGQLGVIRAGQLFGYGSVESFPDPGLLPLPQPPPRRVPGSAAQFQGQGPPPAPKRAARTRCPPGRHGRRSAAAHQALEAVAGAGRPERSPPTAGHRPSTGALVRPCRHGQPAQEREQRPIRL